jgi:ribonuclease HI
VWGCFFLKNGLPIDTLAGLTAAEVSDKATNNLAEYVALINALKEAKRRGWNEDNVILFTDSQLLHGQLELGRKVKSSILLAFYKRAIELRSSFHNIKLEKIGRDRNKVAHRAAQAAFYEARFPPRIG